MPRRADSVHLSRVSESEAVESVKDRVFHDEPILQAIRPKILRDHQSPMRRWMSLALHRMVAHLDPATRARIV